jgi:RND family efflux transporter MFP subunit
MKACTMQSSSSPRPSSQRTRSDDPEGHEPGRAVCFVVSELPDLCDKSMPSLRQVIALFSLSFLASPLSAASGLIEPLQQATLAPTVVGRIQRVLVKEGDAVKAGQVLVELEQDLESLEVERRRLVAENKSEIEIARERAALLEKEWRATAKLREATRSVSQEELDKKQIEYKLARAEAAQLEVREQIEALEYKIAQAQLERRLIRAPNDGVITRVHAQPGEISEVRQPLVALVNASSCYFVANLEPPIAGRLRLGGSARVRVDTAGNGPPFEATGTVDSMSPVVDSASGLRRVKILLPNREGRLTPGLVSTLVDP